MLDVRRRIHLELGIDACDAVLPRADRQVVPGTEVLDVHPRRPAGAVDAALARGLEPAGGSGELFPGLWRPVRVEPGLAVGVLVDVEQIGRASCRERV